MINTGKRSAFTLIELLVVIAIIALLLSVIMPSLAKAKMLSKRLVSSSNMRQIGIAMSLYADENKGYFPETTHTTLSPDRAWIYTLQPYLSNVDKIRICPADPQRKERLDSNMTSYIMNEYLTPFIDFGVLVQSESFHNLHRLRSPSSTITTFVAADDTSATDTNADHVHSRSWFIPSSPDDRWTAIRADIQVDRYRSGGPNEDNTRGTTLFLYADTQVKMIEADTIKQWADISENFAKPAN